MRRLVASLGVSALLGAGLIGSVGAMSAPVAQAATAAPATAAPALHVSGDHLVTQTGVIFQPHGVNEPSVTQDCETGGFWNGGSVAQASSFAEDTANWAGINMVRLQLNEDCWLGINGYPGGGMTASQYQSDIESVVSSLNANGIVVDLSLAFSAPGTTPSSGQNSMIDSDHGPAFWNSVASVFGTNDSVLFELYNEPRPWGASGSGSPGNTVFAAGCVKNGGAAGTCASFATTGMQTIVNTLRNTDGATNVILEGGPHSEQDPNLWNDYAVSDPNNDVAATWHTYPGNACNTQSCWASDVKPVADVVPVVASEVGDNTQNSPPVYSYSPQVTTWDNTGGTGGGPVDNGAIGYAAFDFDHYGGADNMIPGSGSDTPTSPYGTGWASELASAPTNFGGGGGGNTCTIKKDASTPTTQKSTDNTSGTLSSLSFTPPSGTLVVADAAVTYIEPGPDTPTITLSDSNGDTWTEQVSTVDSNRDGSAIFSHYFATSPGPITITMDDTNHTRAQLQLATWDYDGAASSQTGATGSKAWAVAHNTTDTVPITTTTKGSWVTVTSGWGTPGTSTANSITTTNADNTSSGDDAEEVFGHVTALTGTPGAETAGWTDNTSSFYAAASAYEILPATTC